MTHPVQRSRTPMVIGVILVLVVAVAFAAVAAIIVSDGDDETAGPATTSADASTSTTIGGPTVPVDPLAAAVTVAGVPLAPLQNPLEDAAVGIKPPALQGTDYDGRPVSITPGASGRPQLVVVVAHWCPHCNAEVPLLIEWRNSGGVPSTVDVVAISTAADPNQPNYPPGDWLKSQDWQWPVLADDTPADASRLPSAMAAYGVTGYPFFALLDAEGRVVARRSGEIPIADLAALVAQVA